MTQFIPFAGDAKGTLSAVTIGDWVLQVMKVACPNETANYYAEFVRNFSLDDETGSQHLTDAISLFSLLAGQAGLILQVLADAKAKGECEVIQSVQQGGIPKETRVNKSYAELSKESEEFFTILLYLIVWRFENVHEAGKAAGMLCDTLQNSHDLKEFRLSMLQATYNAFPTTFTYRFPIFVAVLEYAAKTNQFGTLLPYICHIEDWMMDWDLKCTAKRQLYLILATQLKKLGKQEESYIYLRQHVETFQGEDSDILSEPAVVGVAVELVEDTLRLSEILYVDTVANLDAVKQLKSTSFGGLTDLINIFLSGTTADLNAFIELNPTFLTQHALDVPELRSKLQLLSLVSAVCGHTCVDLTSLAQALDLSADQTEYLAVTAIGRGLIDGRIDQLSNQLIVTYTQLHFSSNLFSSVIPRRFGKNEWLSLQQKLADKTAAVNELIHILKLTNASKKIQYINDTKLGKTDEKKIPHEERKKILDSNRYRPDDCDNWRA